MRLYLWNRSGSIDFRDDKGSCLGDNQFKRIPNYIFQTNYMNNTNAKYLTNIYVHIWYLPFQDTI